MRKISKELYNNLDLTNIDIAGQSLKYRGLMVFLDKEDEELEKAIEEAGKIAYLVVSEEDLKKEVGGENKSEAVDGEDKGENLQVDLTSLKNADLVEYGKQHFGLTLNVKDKKSDLIIQINKATEEAGKVE